MRRRGTQVLIGLGICWLCFTGTAFAQYQRNNQNNQQNNQNNYNRPSAPEIDVGAATGALTIAAGALTLLRERLRRPSA